MNEIKITSAGKEQIYSAPATFDEMTREQFILTAKHILTAATETPSLVTRHSSQKKPLPETYYPTMTGIDPKVWSNLHFYQRYSIKRLFDFAAETSPPITKQLLPYVITGDQCFIGYQPGFSNTTWHEFIFADQYILTGKFKEAAACLYRPQRSDYTGETDRRIPFTVYGTNSRLHYFDSISEPELLAFLLNYKSLRKIHLEEKYPFVFAPSTTKTQNSPNSQFSWVAIHRDLMGDHFYDEPKFYELNVHIILNRMNTVIRENRYKK